MTMRAFRCAYGVNDDLEDFARAWLAGAGCLSHALEIRDIGNAQVTVLAREGRFQVEMCSVRGGVDIPVHVHPRADTIEVTLAGAVRLLVNGIDPFAFVPDDRLATFARGRGIRINHDDAHGGLVLLGGALFLSIQRWAVEPMSVLTDYIGQRDPQANWEWIA